jgi:hypothetical protein
MSIALAHHHPAQRRAVPARRMTAHLVPGYTLGAASADRLAMGLAIPLLGAMSLCLWYGIFRLASSVLG